jgi:pimeloyl-ACP methyl ester carboxylesterase
MRTIPGLGLLAFLLSSAAVHAQIPVDSPAAPWGLWAGRTIVFIANGSGDSTSVSDNLAMVRGAGSPLSLQTVPWCRTGVMWIDYKDLNAQLQLAGHLAHCVQAIRHSGTPCKIVFIGHSAGTHVVLAAAEKLPPASIERIVLLSSSLSYSYDLSCALRATVHGIDNFYSGYDGLLPNTDKLGTTDGRYTISGGLIGFRPPPAADIGAYGNLRQYGWHEAMPGQGGHYVWTQPYNLRAYIMPLLLNP